MLVVVVVVEVAAVLLHLVHAELRGVHILDAQVKVVELAADLAARLAVLTLDPQPLYVGAANNVVPLIVGDARVLLGLEVAEVLLEGLDSSRHQQGEVVPGSLCLSVHVAKGVGEGLGPCLEAVEMDAVGVDEGLRRVSVGVEHLLVLEADGR